MEGDFVARSSITKMIGSTIGGNGNCVNGVIITNLEAISSRLDQSEDAPSFPLLDPSRALPPVIEFLSSSFSNLESRQIRRWDQVLYLCSVHHVSSTRLLPSIPSDRFQLQNSLSLFTFFYRISADSQCYSTSPVTGVCAACVADIAAKSIKLGQISGVPRESDRAYHFDPSISPIIGTFQRYRLHL